MTALTFFDGSWRNGSAPLIGSLDHASWLGSVVFDGARAFDGVAPDLDQHCARSVASARALGLQPMLTAREIEDIAWDGIRRFPKTSALYIRPMFFGTGGFIMPDPAGTRFAMVIEEMPLPPYKGFSACLSSLRRPSPETAPTDAKASCLYPNVARAMAEAKARGFDNAILLDGLGNVAEFSTANLFLVKDGVVHTPVPNGSFLNGITRQRVIRLLKADGREVVERAVRPAELGEADEIFSTGNYSKVMPVSRFEDRDLQPGPVAARARELYFAYAHGKAPGG